MLPGRTLALGSTHPLTEMSTRDIFWGVKAAGVYGWQTYRFHVPIVLKSGSLNLLQPSGPVQACNGIVLPLQLICIVVNLSKATCFCRSQWPRGLRRKSAAARLLRSWVRIAPGAWIFVCCECCVLSGRGHCDELITRPEEYYRLWCVVVCDLETSRMRRPWSALGRSATKKSTMFFARVCYHQTTKMIQVTEGTLYC
jgi:hypothetical protein